MAIKLVVNEGRTKFSEGRTSGESLAFLRQIKGEEEFEEVHGKSPCKDYLNDILYCEYYDSTCNVHGLKYKKTGFLTDPDFCYFSCNMLSHRKSVLSCPDTNSKFLENIDKYLNRLNLIEDEFKFKHTVSLGITEECVILKVDRAWIKNQYRVSLFGLIWRYCVAYPEEESILTKRVGTPLAIEAIKNDEDNPVFKSCKHSEGIKFYQSKLNSIKVLAEKKAKAEALKKKKTKAA